MGRTELTVYIKHPSLPQREVCGRQGNAEAVLKGGVVRLPRSTAEIIN